MECRRYPRHGDSVFQIRNNAVFKHFNLLFDVCLVAGTSNRVSLKEHYSMARAYHTKGFNANREWLITILTASHHKRMVALDGQDFCRKCFARYISVHRATITRCEKDIKEGRNEAVHGNVGSSKKREKTLEAEAWLSQYAQASGDFLPHKQQIQLPEYSFEHLYERYVEEFRKRADQEGFGLFVRVSPKTLRTIAKDKDMALTLRKFFKSCKICDVLRTARRAKASRADKIVITLELDEHNNLQLAQRAQYSTNKEKATNRPMFYLSISIDDVDRDKAGFPRIPRYTSDLQKMNPWSLHVTATIVHGPYGFTKVYTWYNEFPHDSNILIECFLRTLVTVQARRPDGKLPPVLYLQLDNATTNKNRWLVSLLAVLVELGIFKKIKLCFLMVGHTHNDVDQFFSLLLRLSVDKGLEIMTLPEMHEFFQTLLKGKTIVEHIDRVLDYKAWLDVLKASTIKNISTPRQFRFKMFGQGDASHHLLHTREYMSTSKKEVPDCYEPQDGLRLFEADNVSLLSHQCQAVAKIPMQADHAERSKLSPFHIWFPTIHFQV